MKKNNLYIDLFDNFMKNELDFLTFASIAESICRYSRHCGAATEPPRNIRRATAKTQRNH